MRGQRQQESSREVDLPTPVWEPHVQEFKKLTRSFSRENVAKLPLERVSTTLQDVKRSSESLMLTAHSTIQKIKVGEVGFDGTELSRNKRPEIRRVKDRNTLRRAASESSIRRPKISRALAESPTRKGGSRKQSNETFEWLSSIGEKIASNTDPTNKFAFQLPSAAEFQQQVRCGMTVEKYVCWPVAGPRVVVCFLVCILYHSYDLNIQYLMVTTGKAGA